MSPLPFSRAWGGGTGIAPPRQPSLTPGVSPPSPEDTGCTPWSSRPPSAAGPTPSPRHAAGCGDACTCRGTQGVRERCPLPHCSTRTAPQPPRMEQGHKGWSHSSRGGRGAGQTPAKGRASRGVWWGAQPGGHSPNHLLGRRSDAAVELAELLLGKRRVRER